MLGFEITIWDWITFLALFVVLGAFVVLLVWLAGLPGRIAIARNHPDAEAVKLMGYAGFLAGVPWIQAFIWSFKPTTIIDIRRYPAAEAKAIAEQIAHLKGEPPPTEGKPGATPKPPPDPDKNQGNQS